MITHKFAIGDIVTYINPDSTLYDYPARVVDNAHDLYDLELIDHFGQEDPYTLTDVDEKYLELA